MRDINNKTLNIIEYSVMVLIALIQFISIFFIKEVDFDIIFDTLESSPLFDFSIDTSCGTKSHITFHVWEGKEKEIENGNSFKKVVVEKTNIDKINGYYFCYKYKPYKKLLMVK